MELINNIPIAELILTSVFVCMFLYQLYFWLRYMQGVNRWNRRKRKQQMTTENEQTDTAVQQPAVSVIVCARNEEHNLSDYLPTLLSQQYPQFEVIVVDDGSEDATRIVVERLKYRYNNLRLTFVPRDAWVTSSKKLALTLAAKAAQYDYLLLTDADCRPQSPQWIAQMMSGFTEGKEVVLGFGAYFEKNSLLNRFIQFDTLFVGMQYLGMAYSGHPYMGVGRNLAYKKSTFFNNNGFQGLLSSRAGDDDLFVNKVAQATNTAIVASSESVTWSVPKQTLKTWLQQKRRHLSVSPKYKTISKVRLAFEPLSRAVMYGCLIAEAVICSNWWLPLLVAGLMSVRYLWQSLILTTTAHRWQLRGFGLSIVFFDIFFPLLSLGVMIHNAIFPFRQRW